jgi:hypothetical protein
MQGEGGVAGSQPMSTGTAVHRSPNKLWRSNSIFNLWTERLGLGDCPSKLSAFLKLKSKYRYAKFEVFQKLTIGSLKPELDEAGYLKLPEKSARIKLGKFSRINAINQSTNASSEHESRNTS